MLGWHYTSRELYNEFIKFDGLEPQVVLPQYRHPAVAEFIVDNKAIWVFKNPQCGDSLLGILILVASQHSSTRTCLLEVEYDADASASELASQKEDGLVLLKHVYTVDRGERFGHKNEPIDLIIKPTKRIRLVDEWDLNTVLRGNQNVHRKSEN